MLIVMDQFTRRIIRFGIQCGGVDGPSLCRIFNEAISRQGVPRFLSIDHDPLFDIAGRANPRILEVDEIMPHVPVSHPFVERAQFGESFSSMCCSGTHET